MDAKRRKKKETRRQGSTRVGRAGWGMAFPYLFIGLWCAFIIIMFLWTVAASLSTTKELFTGTLLSSGLHFGNYVKAFMADQVALYFLNSIIYTACACTLIVLIAAPCAYVLARYSFRGNKIMQAVFTSGMGIPIIMVVLPLFYIASLMKLVGTRGIMVFLYTGINLPFSIFFLITFFLSIPSVLEEAAAIDGCSQIKTFWKIVFPLAQPGVVTVTIFNFIAIWNEYFLGLIFGSKTEIRPIAVGLQNMINSMRYSGDWAGMFAALVIVFVPSIVLYVALSEKIIAGVTGGAVKG